MNSMTAETQKPGFYIFAALYAIVAAEYFTARKAKGCMAVLSAIGQPTQATASTAQAAATQAL
jgi:hypothetical protein